MGGLLCLNTRICACADAIRYSAIPQQQPYRAKPSDKWLLGNSSPEKDVGSQDAQQQPITHEDFDDFFNAEPGSDDYA